MAIRFNCPNCSTPLAVPDTGAGKKGKCPKCAAEILVPTSPPSTARPPAPSTRAFDLNIEEVLENWEAEHGIREIIANAIDEQVISNTAEIKIFRDAQGNWCIRDYGRGLRIEHFTLNENKEKLAAPSGVIGKFGVGLKDALATFHRRGIGVLIRSSFGTYRLKQEHKYGFNNIVTLHVEFDDSRNDMCGTEFILSGVVDAQMERAKALFLKFAGEEVLEDTPYGQILRRRADSAFVASPAAERGLGLGTLGALNAPSPVISPRLRPANSFSQQPPRTLQGHGLSALNRTPIMQPQGASAHVGSRDGYGRVYILGVFASEEPNFLFSYNITSLTDAMKKRLNRERLNVGRTTYADRVKAILKGAKSKTVEALLIEQVEKRATGEQADEMSWIEISQMALNLMNKQRSVVYFTESELQSKPNILDNAKRDGYQVIAVTDQQKAKLVDQVLAGGPQVRTVETYVQEFNVSFQYKFVEPSQLTGEERRIYDLTARILAMAGFSIGTIPDIRISETMRITTDDTEGVWDASLSAIVIKRSKLSSLVGYAGTLLHEVGHATTGTVDATREFERVLTEYLGRISATSMNR
jgi:hypothetical protein